MKQRNWLKLIGAWQIIGGIYSAITFLDTVPALGITADRRVVLATFLLAICALSILAGRALLAGSQAGLRASLLVQGIQLAGASTGATAFQLTLGPYVYLAMIWGERLGLDFGFAPRFLWFTNATDAPPAGVVINLLALFFGWKLLRHEPAVAASPPDSGAPESSMPTMKTGSETASPDPGTVAPRGPAA